ncbi:hypothetical protein CTI12_AA614170 [Artemisia annua]|uniref:Glycine-rich protein n=1 Tax=Artemisia annua TaxID=35608 RepID=A0A2U1KDN8_ARTAN|nr:hypothetical protein CTI12_AA614170 [Artemisia annua]
MTKLCFMLLVVLAVVACTTNARDVPSEPNKNAVGLTDQKNVFTFGGLGGYSGFGNDGQPIGGGGIGAGIGTENGIGGIGAGYGYGGGGATTGGLGTIGGLANENVALQL